MSPRNQFIKKWSTLKIEKSTNQKEVYLKVRRILSHVLYLTLWAALIYMVFFNPETCHASVESSLLGLKSKLTGVVLPVLSVCGLVFAGFSFFTGQEQAKQHIIYALLGCAIGFGAQAIVDFISQTVN